MTNDAFLWITKQYWDQNKEKLLNKDKTLNDFYNKITFVSGEGIIVTHGEIFGSINQSLNETKSTEVSYDESMFI